MKRIGYIFLVVFSLLLLVACKPKEKDTYYTVTFDSNGGTNIDTIEVLEGTKVDKPSDPTKEGYKFIHWLLDGKEFDFNTIIDKEITLVAKWKDNKEYVSQRLLLIDFGNSGVSGYDSSSFTFTNESDGNS